MNKEWSNNNKEFQVLISKKETFELGKNKLLELRKELFDIIMLVYKGMPNEGYYAQPFINSTGYDCKTIAYSIYHIMRIEDIVCSVLLQDKEEIFIEKNYQILMNSSIATTGNELKHEAIGEFSKSLNIDVLYDYAKDIYEEGNQYIRALEFSSLKNKIAIEKRKLLENGISVSKDENAYWLIDYWCNKDVLGLLKMPFSRHWIMHVEALLKIKAKLIANAKKEAKSHIAVCGLSCKHCFLGEYCGTCRSKYNNCSYATLFGGVCPNAKCALEHNISSCYKCDRLRDCEIGFFSKSSDGCVAAKAASLFILMYGEQNYLNALDNLHKTYDFKKLQDVLGTDVEEALGVLKKNM